MNDPLLWIVISQQQILVDRHLGAEALESTGKHSYPYPLTAKCPHLGVLGALRIHGAFAYLLIPTTSVIHQVSRTRFIAYITPPLPRGRETQHCEQWSCAKTIFDGRTYLSSPLPRSLGDGHLWIYSQTTSLSYHHPHTVEWNLFALFTITYCGAHC